jgi:streptogramin lyase
VELKEVPFYLIEDGQPTILIFCSDTHRIYCFEQVQGGSGRWLNGDPHFKDLEWRPFRLPHGTCDPFCYKVQPSGRVWSVDVHIRTTARRDMAYISGAVLRIVQMFSKWKARESTTSTV